MTSRTFYAILSLMALTAVVVLVAVSSAAPAIVAWLR